MRRIRSETTFRGTVLALVGALLLVLDVPGPDALAQSNSGTVDVTAEISGETTLSISLCDPTANFGTGLTSEGAPPTTDDSVQPVAASSQSDPGAYYQWESSCTDQARFLHVESSIPWLGALCASENTGSSSLSIAAGDLRWDQGGAAQAPTYNTVLAKAAIPLCNPEAPSYWEPDGQAGAFDFDFNLYLHVADVSTSGSFAAVTHWEITA